MSRLGDSPVLAGEWIKLTTVRAPAAIVVASVLTTEALALRSVLDSGRHGTPSAGTGAAALTLLGACSSAAYFALVLGVLVVTEEFHHGTITGSVLLTPRRWRLVVGKGVTAVTAGLAIGVLTLLAAVVVGVAGRTITFQVWNPDLVLRAVGLALTPAAYAGIGTAVGVLLTRTQALAVVLPIVWLTVLEQLVVGVLDPKWIPWTLGGATAALRNSGDAVGVLSMWGGAAMLAVAVVGLGAAGGQRLVRTDLT